MAEFSWSWSKLEGFETCGKRYYEYYVAKTIKDTDTDNIDWGNKVHDAMKDAIKTGNAIPQLFRPGSLVPEDITTYQVWVDRVRAGPGELFVEQKYGLDSNLSPVPYFGRNVWYRGIADVVRVDSPIGLAIDWKTGKPKEGSIQLGLMALCLFQHYPKLAVVRTEYVWLQEDPDSPEATTSKVWRREEMVEFVSKILPRVQKLQWAHNTNTFEPKPSGLCVRYCKVVSCPFNGRGTR